MRGTKVAHFAKRTYIEVAEAFFGVVIGGFGVGLIAGAIGAPLWLFGHKEWLNSTLMAWLVVSVALLVWIWVAKRFWHVAKGLCVGLLIGLIVCTAGLMLPPLH